jgi:hypothetical protein
MQRNNDYILMTRDEFFKWLMALPVSRFVKSIQNHHTYEPSYKRFNGSNHFAMQQSMENYHISIGMVDIAQHFSTFPDGLICTGRSLELIPAGIKGFNTGSICIEHVGNFDRGFDIMSEEQKKTVAFLNAVLCLKFGIPIKTDNIVYHHWFRLSDGARFDGTLDDPNQVKTCPGTNFFNGNNRPDADQFLIPAVETEFIVMKYPQWQIDCSRYLQTLGFTQKLHFPDKIVNMQTFGYMMNNYFSKLNPVDPIQYLIDKGFMKSQHPPEEALVLGVFGYIIANTEKVVITDPIKFLLDRGYITSTTHTYKSPVYMWTFGAIMNKLLQQRTFNLP